MTKSPQATGLSRGEAEVMDRAHHFAHEAMATVFEVFVIHEDPEYARQGAQAAFDEVDRLEQELSRFIENSDISRLNAARPGEPVTLGLDAFECLERAVQIHEQTHGAFNVAVGALYECWLNEDKSLRRPSAEEIERARRLTRLEQLTLHPENFTAEVMTEGMRFDLGGIGKGYAAGRMAEIFREWSLDRALLLAGASSVLALDAPDGSTGWPLTLSNPRNRNEILARLNLANRAISGSGLQKGEHIIDPRPSKLRPVEGKQASWSLAGDATLADALSTAFMIMESTEINQFCQSHPGIAAAVLKVSGNDESAPVDFEHFGAWEAVEFSDR